MNDDAELELSAAQHWAIVAVDVIKLVNREDGRRERVLYYRAVGILSEYLAAGADDENDVYEEPGDES